MISQKINFRLPSDVFIADGKFYKFDSNFKKHEIKIGEIIKKKNEELN